MSQTNTAPVTWITVPDMGFEDIKYEKSPEGIAKITINRPECRNAFRPRTVKEMSRAIDDARDDAEVGVVGVANILATRSDTDVNLIYRITKNMFENRAELGAIHPEAKKLSLENATSGSPVPFHIGAVRYFAEKGVKLK